MSRLADIQARFQQKQMQEKEEKLLKLYESQQQRAFERVGRGSTGNNLSGGTSPVGAGKVRQMFDERRQKAGIDRSYPLEPLKQTKPNGYAQIANRVPNLERSNNTISRNTIKTTSNFKTSVQRSVTQTRTGKPPVSYSARHAAEASFVNGELKSGNIEYEVRGDSDTLDILKNQEKELEILMKNHRIDDEKFYDVGVDEDVIDNNQENHGDHGRSVKHAIENGNVKEKSNKIREVSHHRPSEHVPVVNRPSEPAPAPVRKSPAKTYAAIKEKATEKVKKPLTKTQSTPAKTQPSPVQHSSRPQSSAESHHSAASSFTPEKKPQMKTSNLRRSAGSQKPPSARATVSPRVPSSVNTDDLKPCTFCNRRFATDRITLHEEICARTLKKKRKTYDPVRHRVQGTDAEGYIRKGKGTTAKAKPYQVSKSDWRRQHEEFINAIRAAKQAQAHVARGGKLSDLPPPPPSYNPDYIQCPHCGRRFNEAAAARHIPKCATMLHNKPNRPGLPPKRRF